MDYKDVLDRARERMLPNCRVCNDCNGLACKGEIPGLGGIRSGNSFTVTREFFKKVKVNMDVIYDADQEIDTSVELFGKKFEIPFSLAPIGGMKGNYNGYFEENDYIDLVVRAMRDNGSFAFTPDGPNDKLYFDSLPIIKRAGGIAVPTVKPWEKELLIKKLEAGQEAGVLALACDVDSCGNLNLKLAGKPVYPLSPENIKLIVEKLDLPFIVKGVMTAEAAKKCMDAGCYGIVVSTHGGRVIEDAPAPAQMLPEIREAVGDKIKIFVDGGVRTGFDVFKCLALGADAVMIGRPYVIAAHGGMEEGIAIYTKKILDELKEIMMMTGCKSIKDINISKVRI